MQTSRDTAELLGGQADEMLQLLNQLDETGEEIIVQIEHIRSELIEQEDLFDEQLNAAAQGLSQHHVEQAALLDALHEHVQQSQNHLKGQLEQSDDVLVMLQHHAAALIERLNQTYTETLVMLQSLIEQAGQQLDSLEDEFKVTKQRTAALEDRLNDCLTDFEHQEHEIIAQINGLEEAIQTQMDGSLNRFATLIQMSSQQLTELCAMVAALSPSTLSRIQHDLLEQVCVVLQSCMEMVTNSCNTLNNLSDNAVAEVIKGADELMSTINEVIDALSPITTMIETVGSLL